MSKSAKRDSVTALFSQFAGQDGTLVIPRAYISFCQGDHLAALLLSQILYWSDRTDDPDGWFAKSYDDWRAELCMTDYQIKRAISGDKRRKNSGFCLESVGVETKLRQSKFYGGAATLHYRVNQEVLRASINTYMDSDNVGNETKADLNIVGNPIPTMSKTGSPCRSEQCPERSTEITTETTETETTKAVESESVESVPIETITAAAATADTTPEKTVEQEAEELIAEAKKLAEQPFVPETKPDPDFVRVCRHFENHIQPLSQIIGEKLKEAITTYPADWITDAIDQAVLYNKRNWAYIDAILKRKQAEGATTHEQQPQTGRPSGSRSDQGRANRSPGSTTETILQPGTPEWERRKAERDAEVIRLKRLKDERENASVPDVR
jgi:DnaD/phage-associated family protein